MKKKEERMEKQMAEITAKNKMLAEPLQKAQEEVEDLKKELANYEKDKETLRVNFEMWKAILNSFVLPMIFTWFFLFFTEYM